ncbi:MAG: hypothetical protein QXF82_06375, partial [Nitrososphaeria archaeon]
MLCIAPVTIQNVKSKFSQKEFRYMDVPCGKCPACLTNRRNDWSLRLAIELENSYGAHFITLTYNNDNIPELVNEETGEIVQTVLKKDLQNYIKRLRKNSNEENLRYYAVGEYGTKTMRPHYHILLFNLPQNKVDYITTCWNAKGFCKIGTITPASIHYVTKYHVNKTHFPESANPSFTLMSRKPGIGYHYVDKFKTFHQGNIDRAHITQLGGVKRRLPRYLKDKLYNKAEMSL